MSASPGRRWFAFRLRTLFVLVAVLSIPLAWVGYSLNWIRQRHEVLEQKEGEAIEMKDGQSLASQPNAPNYAPGGLWLFGERGILAIFLYPEEPDGDVERVKRLFPEADVRHYPMARPSSPHGPWHWKEP